MIASRQYQQIVLYHSDSVVCRHHAWLQTSQMLAWQAWSLRQSCQFGDARNTIKRSGPQILCNTCTASLWETPSTGQKSPPLLIPLGWLRLSPLAWLGQRFHEKMPTFCHTKVAWSLHQIDSQCTWGAWPFTISWVSHHWWQAASTFGRRGGPNRSAIASIQLGHQRQQRRRFHPQQLVAMDQKWGVHGKWTRQGRPSCQVGQVHWMCKWSHHLRWSCCQLTVSYCHDGNPLQPQILQVWSWHSPSEACIQELKGLSPSGKMGPHGLQMLRWMFDMCAKREPWKWLEHLLRYWRERSSGLRPKTKCSNHQNFPSMSSCQPQSAPNVVVIEGIFSFQVRKEIWEFGYCAICHCHPKWWTWMSPFPWLVAHQSSHPLSPYQREQDCPTGRESWCSSTMHGCQHQ